MDLRSKIFAKLRSYKFKSGHLWSAQQWLTFKNNLRKEERSAFDTVITELCSEGIFTAEPYNKDLSNYRLTDKGEAVLRNLI